MLTSLATELGADAAGAADGAKVRSLASAVSQLANAQSAAGCAPRVLQALAEGGLRAGFHRPGRRQGAPMAMTALPA